MAKAHLKLRARAPALPNEVSSDMRRGSHFLWGYQQRDLEEGQLPTHVIMNRGRRIKSSYFSNMMYRYTPRDQCLEAGQSWKRGVGGKKRGPYPFEHFCPGAVLHRLGPGCHTGQLEGFSASKKLPITPTGHMSLP